jgi:hypothetical protein
MHWDHEPQQIEDEDENEDEDEIKRGDEEEEEEEEDWEGSWRVNDSGIACWDHEPPGVRKRGMPRSPGGRPPKRWRKIRESTTEATTSGAVAKTPHVVSYNEWRIRQRLRLRFIRLE